MNLRKLLFLMIIIALGASACTELHSQTRAAKSPTSTAVTF